MRSKTKTKTKPNTFDSQVKTALSGRRMESKIVDSVGKLKEKEIKEFIKDKGVRERHLAWFIDEDMRNCIKAVS